MPPSSEQFAQLAALFTTSTDSTIRSSIELLLPAHLPVQGGLWLVPYAGREAEQGLSMLVRMHEEEYVNHDVHRQQRGLLMLLSFHNHLFG